MDAYYHTQATMPHFSGHYRQRGSGFDALAMGIGRVALPLARKFIVPATKLIGKELLVQAAPEIIDIATKKKTPRLALKNTVKKKQSKNKLELGAASRVWAENARQQQQQKEKEKFSFQRNELHWGVAPIFSPKYEMISNLLPTEATHSSLDLFEKPPLLATFENAFTQNSPDSPMLEF